jgi:hypothetical protein
MEHILGRFCLNIRNSYDTNVVFLNMYHWALWLQNCTRYIQQQSEIFLMIRHIMKSIAEHWLCKGVKNRGKHSPPNIFPRAVWQSTPPPYRYLKYLPYLCICYFNKILLLIFHGMNSMLYEASITMYFNYSHCL